MKLVFVGTLTPHQLCKELLCAGAYQAYAADTFQSALLEGFELNNCKIDLITSPSMVSYPKFARFVQKGFFFKKGDKERFSGESIGFINLPVVKLVCKFINLSRVLRKKHLVDTPVIVYGVSSFLLLSTTLFAKKAKKYLVVPDLPEFMSDNSNIVYRVLKRIDRLIINFTLKYIDGYILLSKDMATPMRADNKPQVLIEGIYSKQEFNPKPPITIAKKEKIVLYTGKIEQRFGLRDLLSAFSQIQGDDYRLWICGGGETDMIDEYTSKDSRIIYFGTLPREQVLKMQQEATLLVNPRHSNEEFTKYSFPSKTMEYMASGTPTLMCKLESLPDEYHKHLFFFEDESVSGMSRRIKELLDAPIDEMRQFGQNASRFIIEQKNAVVQTRKILNMIYNKSK